MSPRAYVIRFADQLPEATAKGFMRELEQLGAVLPFAPSEWEIVVQREPELARLRKLLARWERAGSVTWKPFP